MVDAAGVLCEILSNLKAGSQIHELELQLIRLFHTGDHPLLVEHFPLHRNSNRYSPKLDSAINIMLLGGAIGGFGLTNTYEVRPGTHGLAAYLKKDAETCPSPAVQEQCRNVASRINLN